MREILRAQALEEIKSLHRTAPKYSLDTESEAAFLARLPVDVLHLEAEVLPGGDVFREDGGSSRPEEYVSGVLQEKGFEVILCESRPFHVLFAVLLKPLVQDRSDAKVRLVLFGERASWEATGVSATQVTAFLPADFGTSGYSTRRRSEIERFFNVALPKDTRSLLVQFDKRTDDAFALRQYLWAHRDEDLSRARRIIEVLPPEFTLAALRYLIDDYWANYLGWPDLLAWRGPSVLFAEVKLSRDKLSDEQRHWIEANQERLHFPFKLAKIRRRESR